MPKVTVIIPNWNGVELLKICLPSLNKQTYKDFEIVVVDNGSRDGSVKYIEKNFKQIRLIRLSINSGFCHAVNLGIKATQSRYVVLLNNDTKVDNKCLEYLIKAADTYPKAGMIAAKILNFDNPKIIDSAGGFVNAVGHGINVGIGEKDSEKFRKGGYVFLVTGGGSLIKREVFESIGFFDENFFAYMEDVDFCMRAQMQGFKGYFEPRAIIYHKHKATSNKNPAFLEYLQFRNMTQNIIKNFPDEHLFKDLNLLKIILVNINTCFYLLKRGFWLSAFKAQVFIIVNLPRLLRQRHKIQSNMKVAPEYIQQNIVAKRITFFGLLKTGI